MTRQEPPAGGNSGDALIAVVEELRTFLAQDNLSMRDVAEWIGHAVGGDPSDRVEVQPRLAGVSAAQVLSYPETGLPYLVTIEPEDSATTTPAQLRSHFGDFTGLPTHFGAPRELSFTGHRDTQPWRVVVLVTVEPTRELERGRVTQITFRRDPPN
jgi:hypothetical protein